MLLVALMIVVKIGQLTTTVKKQTNSKDLKMEVVLDVGEVNL